MINIDLTKEQTEAFLEYKGDLAMFYINNDDISLYSDEDLEKIEIKFNFYKKT